ncbi:putative DnaJ chaperone protein [Trypanosoma theileri]|uniref:Putative DnaJ chaperone protein n=1 Tax=Trypanosoma theileri TaxID=67003 RepID=A0A1X0NWB2_9TRYP|nr:putative DnaJ chaperone protein [Trypanosoma theileri]ORC88977.1 putative DnaJ chaperone protein [Trypanosoma theileri]
MMTLPVFDIPHLEKDEGLLLFNVEPTLLCGMATGLRVLPHGMALQQQARMTARLWVEKERQQRHHARRHEDPHAMSGSDVDDDDDDDGNDGSYGDENQQQQQQQQNFRRKKFVKLTDEDLQVDWYDVLRLEQGEGATEEQIRAAYRRRCLETHPDKQKDRSDEAFKKVQRAFDILGDAETRLAYDSSRPFDDSIPPETLPSGADFYATFGPVFERNKKWSSEPNLPSIGDDNMSLKDVNRFYDRWARFQSWRDFSHLVELDEIDDGMCREEKRYYMRENARQLQQFRREEQQRLRTLVERARRSDPRLRRAREAAEREAAERLAEREAQRVARHEAREARRVEQQQREAAEAKEAAERVVRAKQEIRQAQQDLLAFLREHELLDETPTNKFFRHVVRKPNVTWLFAKIHTPERAAAVLREVTECSTERRQAEPQQEAVTNNNNNNNHYHHHRHHQQNDDDEGVEVEAVLRFNALVEDQEQQIGLTRYGEPVKKRPVVVPAAKAPEPEKKPAAEAPAAKKQEEWDEEDLVRLQKATAKFPPGAVDRWEKIAGLLRGKFTPEEAMAKVNEITAALHHSNNNSSNARAAGQPQPSTTPVKVPSTVVAATTASTVPPVEDWTVKQQKQLEQGLRELKDYKEKDKFQKIAAMVDGKNAKECFERFKHLCAISKRK